MKYLFKNIYKESVSLCKGNSSLYDKVMQLQGREWFPEHMLTAPPFAGWFHMSYLYYLPIYTWANWGQEKLNDLPEHRFLVVIIWPQSHCFYCCKEVLTTSILNLSALPSRLFSRNYLSAVSETETDFAVINFVPILLTRGHISLPWCRRCWLQVNTYGWPGLLCAEHC